MLIIIIINKNRTNLTNTIGEKKKKKGNVLGFYKKHKVSITSPQIVTPPARTDF